jgi:hypothetical protein
MNCLRLDDRTGEEDLALDPREHSPAVRQGSMESGQPVLTRHQIRQNQAASAALRRRPFQSLPKELTGGARGDEDHATSGVDRSAGPGKPDERPTKGRESPGANEYA